MKGTVMSRKTTKELIELMKSSKDYEEYLRANGENISNTSEPHTALNTLISEIGLKKSEVIARSGIEEHYAYQIFSGIKTPSRDKMIMLCIAIGLSPDEAIDLMKITGYAPLYAKNARDNAVIYALTKKMTVIELNCMLFDRGIEIFQ